MLAVLAALALAVAIAADLPGPWWVIPAVVLATLQVVAFRAVSG